MHVLDITLPVEDERNPLVASYIQGDIREVSHVQEALTGIDTVFHTAGVFSHNVNVTDKVSPLSTYPDRYAIAKLLLL